MTADEARERIGDIRVELRRAMRAISRTEPDWEAAADAASECVRMSAELQSRCWMEDFERRRYDSVYR